MRNSITVLGLGLVLLFALVPLTGQASEMNLKTYVTFNTAVQVPGMILQPGTYVFQLENGDRFERTVVKIFNENMTHFYTSVEAIKDYRGVPPNNAVVSFDTRGPGLVAAKEWYYPGRNFGLQFVYHDRDIELARNYLQPKVRPAVATPAHQPPPTVELEKQPEEQPQAATIQPQPIPNPPMQNQPMQTPSMQQTEEKPAVATVPSELPRTASNLPLIGLAGLLALGLASMLAIAARSGN